MLPRPLGQQQDQRVQTRGWGSDGRLRFHGQEQHVAGAVAGQQLDEQVQLWTAKEQTPEMLFAVADGGSVPVDATLEYHTTKHEEDPGF